MVCLFCNEAGMPWLEQDGWKSRLCPGCGLVFLSPRPTEDEIAAIYERGTSHTSPEHHLARRGSWVTRYQARRTVRMLRHRCPPPARLIEIGPGDGSVLVAAREAGYDVAGVELNPIQAAAIRDGDNIACVETLDKIGELGRFDLVYHRDVLSHLHDPVAVFEQLRAALNPGGLIVFETGPGNYRREYASLLRSLQFPDHLYFFSEDAVDKLLARTGFDLVSRRAYGVVPQLRVDRWMRHALGVRGSVADGSQPAAVPGRAWEAMQFVRLQVRYTLGAFAPKRDRPRTLIYTARRSH